MTRKVLLVPDRVRRPPREGFSWIDRRFLRDFAARISGDAIMLYFFLAAVSDRQGLSFYSDASIAVRLRMSQQHVASARDELVQHDLIAYRAPLAQVLALPVNRTQRGGSLPGLQALGSLLRRVDEETDER
jgi:hypothetical protein